MIKELNKYSKELTIYRKQGGLPQGDVKNALVDIYEANWANNKLWGASKISRGCPSCISDMMKSLCAAWEQGQVEFKGVPQKETLEHFDGVMKEVGEMLPKPTIIIKSNGHDLNEVIKMKWGEFKKYCSSKGINIKGKTRVQLMEELERC